MRKSKRKEKKYKLEKKRKLEKKQKLEKQRNHNEDDHTQMENSANFPFINIDETVEYVKKSQVLFIMRGLPGSGKSTIVQMIKQKYKRAVVCSADSYFMNENGNYVFDSSKLHQAHQECKDKATGACANGASVVIIDNTNIKWWEIRPYVVIAAEFCYTVVIVEPQTWWKFIPEELAARNKRKIDVVILESKVKAFKNIIPLYYGWFLNRKDSRRLIDLGRKYANACFILDNTHSKGK